MTIKLSRAELEEMLKGMSPEEMLRTLELMEELDTRKRIKICQDSLPAFVMEMQPDYKMGGHLKKLYSLLEDVEMGHKDRILVNMPPRFGKSQAISIYFPAWYLGNNPTHKIIIASHTADLAVDMLRKVRNIMQSEEYQKIFPGVKIAADAKAAGKWDTNQGGQAYAVGVGGALAGRGGHLCLDGNTICEVDDGKTKLADIKPGRKIKTFYGWERVTNRSLTIHKQAVKINSVLASLNHPMLTNKGWVDCGNLQVGDKIKTATIWSRTWTTANTLLKTLLAKRGKA